MLLPRIALSPSTRGNLLLACLPIGVTLLAHGLSALEDLIENRTAHLAALEARIAGARAELDKLTPPVVIDEDPPDPGEATHHDPACAADHDPDSPCPTSERATAAL